MKRRNIIAIILVIFCLIITVIYVIPKSSNRSMEIESEETAVTPIEDQEGDSNLPASFLLYMNGRPVSEMGEMSDLVFSDEDGYKEIEVTVNSVRYTTENEGWKLAFVPNELTVDENNNIISGGMYAVINFTVYFSQSTDFWWNSFMLYSWNEGEAHGIGELMWSSIVEKSQIGNANCFEYLAEEGETATADCVYFVTDEDIAAEILVLEMSYSANENDKNTPVNTRGAFIIDKSDLIVSTDE